MNEQDILELFHSYEEYFHKLSHQPLKPFMAEKTPHFYLSKEEIEDIHSELQVYFFEIMELYEEEKGSDVKAYIHSRLSWKAHDIGEKMVEARKRMVYKELNNIPEPEKPIWDERKDEILEILKKEIEKLPERQKEVMIKYYFENVPTGKLAREMDTVKQAVVTLRNIGIEKLKKLDLDDLL